MTALQLLDFPKLISRKIWMTQISWNFHTVAVSVFINVQIFLIHPVRISPLKVAHESCWDSWLWMPFALHFFSDDDGVWRQCAGVRECGVKIPRIWPWPINGTTVKPRKRNLVLLWFDVALWQFSRVFYENFSYTIKMENCHYSEKRSLQFTVNLDVYQILP